MKEIPRVGDVEKINLHLRLDGWLAPHFVRLATNFQDQLLLIIFKKAYNHDDDNFIIAYEKRESLIEVNACHSFELFDLA